jgi:hypothetical protein
MTQLEKVSHDSEMGRDLFVISIPSSTDLPAIVPMTTRRFLCVLAWDARRASLSDISAVARWLLDSGAVYVCAWGPDCERVHDIIDEEHIGPNPDPAASQPLMTTWHDKESLDDVLGFVLTLALPDDAYLKECGSTLGISIGSAEWTHQIRAAFTRPRDFVQRWSAE